MADKAMGVYLDDHLAGAMLGSDLAGQLRDRDLDVSRNPVRQVGGWLSEKASRVKFSGASSGEPDHGALMALETLRLGVAGKKCLSAERALSGGH